MRRLTWTSRLLKPPRVRGEGRRQKEEATDLSARVPLDPIAAQEALFNCAGHVADGDDGSACEQ